VFGAAYLPAVPVVQVFALYVVVHTINQITSDGLDYLGRARSRAIAKGVAAVSNVLLNLLLVPMVGVIGAAIATVITHTFYTGANVAVIHSELGLQFRALAVDIGWVTAITVGMGGVVALVTPLVSGPATFAAVVALGGTVWLGLSIASGLIDPRQVRTVLF
jgi:O-antigen/teichoic acid export membrane protein